MCATASTPERQRDISGAANHVLLNQLPELYAGLQRDPTGFPVQYLGATYLRPGPGYTVRTAAGDARIQPDTPLENYIVEPLLPSGSG